MNLAICNRDASGKFTLPADGWCHLVPRGEFPHPESGVLQVVDDQALRSMVNQFAEDSKRPNFPGLLVDFDHFSYDADKSSAAAGWVERVENRADGLWGKVRWSEEGQQSLESGKYRLISPTWTANDIAVIANRKKVRPLRLDSLGLTNQPNMRGMVPLSNRDNFKSGEEPNKKGNMTKINTALGLAPEAAEESALAAIAQIKNRAESAEAANAPLKNRVTALETENQTLLDGQVEATLDQYKNRFKPEVRDQYKIMLLANRASTIKVLEALPQPDAGASARAPMHNRSAAGVPAGGATAEDQANQARLAVEEYRIANRCTFDQAWQAVSAKHPEMFKG